MRKKSKLTAYKNNDRVCFCKIKFSSGEHILVSIASVPEHSIKVIKLLAGIIPYKTIWEFNATHAGLLSMFTEKTVHKVKHPLDAIILKLVPCISCYEALDVLHQAEKTYRNS